MSSEYTPYRHSKFVNIHRAIKLRETNGVTYNDLERHLVDKITLYYPERINAEIEVDLPIGSGNGLGRRLLGFDVLGQLRLTNTTTSTQSVGLVWIGNCKPVHINKWDIRPSEVLTVSPVDEGNIPIYKSTNGSFQIYRSSANVSVRITARILYQDEITVTPVTRSCDDRLYRISDGMCTKIG